ncbi:MAG TPA: hypothetical protein EYP85_15350 [Armatimonadetes bacterium]|nr:hypothetical protein [Armatimonadota bacterium]
MSTPSTSRAFRGVVSGATGRAVLVGAGLCLFISVAEPYSALVNFSTGFCADFITAAALVLFFLLVGGGNALMHRLRPAWALTTSELIVVFCMMIVACAIPTWGLTANLLPILSGVFYYAKPSNEWATLIHPHLPEWIVPREELLHRYFFEGLPKGENPWPYIAQWTRPLLCWSAFLLMLYLVMICLMVLIRRQWVNNERLLFPLNVVPLEMVGTEGRRDWPGRAFFTHKLMWLGFAVAFLLNTWNGFAHYIPFLSRLNLTASYSIFRGTTWTGLVLSFPVVGFVYFINTDVAFSVWFFHLVDRGINGFMGITGYQGIKGKIEVFCDTVPIISHASMGAMIALVLFTLYGARRHLQSVFRKALHGDPTVDDGEEPLSYRGAVWGVILGVLFLTGWLRASGMPVWMALLFQFGMFVIYLGLTRIIAEGGFGFCRAECIPPIFVLHGVPAHWFSPAAIVALGPTYAYAADIRTIVMTSALHGFKLAEATHTRLRGLFWPLMLACALALGGSLVATLYYAYTKGGATFQDHGWFFNGMPTVASWKVVEEKLRDLPEWSNSLARWWATGFGAALMFFLLFMRQRFLWWPLHYLGMPIAGTYVVRQIWFSVLLGWAVKGLILKYGGIRLFRRLKPLFLGFIMGQLMCAFVWAVVAFATGERTSMGIWIGVP